MFNELIRRHPNIRAGRTQKVPYKRLPNATKEIGVKVGKADLLALFPFPEIMGDPLDSWTLGPLDPWKPFT